MRLKLRLIILVTVALMVMAVGRPDIPFHDQPMKPFGEDGGVEGWSPAALSNLSFWVYGDGDKYTDDGTTPATAEDDLVYRWDNMAGTGDNFVQTTSSKRPLLKLNVYNGHAGMQFDGADDFFVSTLRPDNSSTTILLYKTTTVSEAGTHWMAGNTTGWILYRTARTQYYDTYIAGGWMSVADIADNTPYTSVMRPNVTEIDFFHNGTKTNRVANVVSFNADLNYGEAAGTSSPSVNDIALEVIHYTDVKTDEEVALILAYLNTKYGLTL